VISGFGDMSIRISWEDQIVANFSGRLSAKINLIKDEELKGVIYSEMCVPCSHYENRLSFLSFFRDNMLSIREEMYEEFKEHITDESFDLYIRKAIIVYEGAM
jgi:hypothetical protein